MTLVRKLESTIINYINKYGLREWRTIFITCFFFFIYSRESILTKLCKKIRNGFLGRLYEKFITPNTIENFVAKSFLGFTGKKNYHKIKSAKC